MTWDLTWKYPLLLDDEGRVIAKDNSPSPEGVVCIKGRPTREQFIYEAENFVDELEREMDE